MVRIPMSITIDPLHSVSIELVLFVEANLAARIVSEIRTKKQQ